MKNKLTKEERDIEKIYSSITYDMIQDFKKYYNSFPKVVTINNTEAEILLRAKLRKEYVDKINGEYNGSKNMD